jgi:hypothetical protein
MTSNRRSGRALQANPKVSNWGKLLRLSLGKIMSGLQVEPELWRRPECAGKEPGGLRSHPALAPDDLVYPLNRDL